VARRSRFSDRPHAPTGLQLCRSGQSPARKGRPGSGTGANHCGSPALVDGDLRAAVHDIDVTALREVIDAVSTCARVRAGGVSNCEARQMRRLSIAVLTAHRALVDSKCLPVDLTRSLDADLRRQRMRHVLSSYSCSEECFWSPALRRGRLLLPGSACRYLICAVDKLKVLWVEFGPCGQVGDAPGGLGGCCMCGRVAGLRLLGRALSTRQHIRLS
jgi:hypothetical protein